MADQRDLVGLEGGRLMLLNGRGQRLGLVVGIAEHLVERHEGIALADGVGDEAAELLEVVLVGGVEQVDIAGREGGGQLGGRGAAAGDGPVGDAVVAHLPGVARRCARRRPWAAGSGRDIPRRVSCSARGSGNRFPWPAVRPRRYTGRCG